MSREYEADESEFDREQKSILFYRDELCNVMRLIEVCVNNLMSSHINKEGLTTDVLYFYVLKHLREIEKGLGDL